MLLSSDDLFTKVIIQTGKWQNLPKKNCTKSLKANSSMTYFFIEERRKFFQEFPFLKL